MTDPVPVPLQRKRAGRVVCAVWLAQRCRFSLKPQLHDSAVLTSTYKNEKLEKDLCGGTGLGALTPQRYPPTGSELPGQHGAYRMGKEQLFGTMGTVCRCGDSVQPASKPPLSQGL